MKARIAFQPLLPSVIAIGVTGGLVITHVNLGSSGGVRPAHWRLMTGVSPGLPNGELPRLLD